MASEHYNPYQRTLLPVPSALLWFPLATNAKLAAALASADDTDAGESAAAEDMNVSVDGVATAAADGQGGPTAANAPATPAVAGDSALVAGESVVDTSSAPEQSEAKAGAPLAADAAAAAGDDDDDDADAERGEGQPMAATEDGVR